MAQCSRTGAAKNLEAFSNTMRQDATTNAYTHKDATKKYSTADTSNNYGRSNKVTPKTKFVQTVLDTPTIPPSWISEGECLINELCMNIGKAIKDMYHLPVNNDYFVEASGTASFGKKNTKHCKHKNGSLVSKLVLDIKIPTCTKIEHQRQIRQSDKLRKNLKKLKNLANKIRNLVSYLKDQNISADDTLKNTNTEDKCLQTEKVILNIGNDNYAQEVEEFNMPSYTFNVFDSRTKIWYNLKENDQCAETTRNKVTKRQDQIIKPQNKNKKIHVNGKGKAHSCSILDSSIIELDTTVTSILKEIEDWQFTKKYQVPPANLKFALPELNTLILTGNEHEPFLDNVEDPLISISGCTMTELGKEEVVNEIERRKFHENYEACTKSVYNSAITELGSDYVNEREIGKFHKNYETCKKSVNNSTITKLGSSDVNEKEIGQLHKNYEAGSKSIFHSTITKFGSYFVNKNELEQIHEKYYIPSSILDSAMTELDAEIINIKLDQFHKNCKATLTSILGSTIIELNTDIVNKKELCQSHESCEAPSTSNLVSTIADIVNRKELYQFHKNCEALSTSMFDSTITALNNDIVNKMELYQSHKNCKAPAISILDSTISALNTDIVNKKERYQSRENCDTPLPSVSDSTVTELDLANNKELDQFHKICKVPLTSVFNSHLNEFNINSNVLKDFNENCEAVISVIDSTITESATFATDVVKKRELHQLNKICKYPPTLVLDAISTESDLSENNIVDKVDINKFNEKCTVATLISDSTIVKLETIATVVENTISAIVLDRFKENFQIPSTSILDSIITELKTFSSGILKNGEINNFKENNVSSPALDSKTTIFESDAGSSSGARSD